MHVRQDMLIKSTGTKIAEKFWLNGRCTLGTFGTGTFIEILLGFWITTDYCKDTPLLAHRAVLVVGYLFQSEGSVRAYAYEHSSYTRYASMKYLQYCDPWPYAVRGLLQLEHNALLEYAEYEILMPVCICVHRNDEQLSSQRRTITVWQHYHISRPLSALLDRFQWCPWQEEQRYPGAQSRRMPQGTLLWVPCCWLLSRIN